MAQSELCLQTVSPCTPRQWPLAMTYQKDLSSRVRSVHGKGDQQQAVQPGTSYSLPWAVMLIFSVALPAFFLYLCLWQGLFARHLSLFPSRQVLFSGAKLSPSHLTFPLSDIGNYFPLPSSHSCSAFPTREE